jgi:sulfite exporter TauE/SafE
MLGLLILACGVILALPWFFKVDSVTSFTGASSLLLIFLTGLTMGGLSCMAVQGGLLASSIAQREKIILEKGEKVSGHAVHILVFLSGKMLAYVLLGFFLGWLGSLLTLTNTIQGIITLVAGLFMLATAFNLLEVHPIFRYVILQPPRSFMRFLRHFSKRDDFFTPAVLGFLTILIPCGTTVAMEALAISTGNPLTAALVMGSFILGTTPVFFTLGYFASRLGETLQAKFMKVAAVAIILLSLFSFSNALNLLESPVSLNSITTAFSDSNKTVIAETIFEKSSTGDLTPFQLLKITVLDEGYTPLNFQVKSGVPIRFRLTTNNTVGCTRSFTINRFGVWQVLPVTGQTDIDLPAQPPGTFKFMCSMGMSVGTITVI